MEEGYNAAMKEYEKKHRDQLDRLVRMLQGSLDKGVRQMITTICTLEVHARDVTAGLIRDRVESASSFAWQSQLRHIWDDHQQDCVIHITDVSFRYQHEYLGNTSRLVVTSLTDRCCTSSYLPVLLFFFCLSSSVT